MAGCTSDERCWRVIRPPPSYNNSETPPREIHHRQQHTDKVQCWTAQRQGHTSSFPDQPFQQVPAATRADRRQWDRHWNTVGTLQEALARHIWRGPWQEEDPAQGMDLCRHHPQAGNKERGKLCWAAKARAQEEYMAVDREVKRSIKKDKRDYIDDLGRQAETAAGQVNLRDLYLLTKKLRGKFQLTDKPVIDKNGNPLTTTDEQMKRWAEHFRELLNLPISCDKPSKTDQEGHHDPEEWEGCRTRWDTSRSHQSRQRQPSRCYTASSARSGRRRRYRPSGKKESSSSCQKKETLGTAATIEGSCSCQHQARFSTGFYWRGWRGCRSQAPWPAGRLPAEQILCRPDRQPAHHRGTVTGVELPPLHQLHRLWEGLWQCRQGDNVEATETLWSLQEDNLPHPVHLPGHELQNCLAGQLSESFEVKTGVRQGCLLSPFAFLLVMDWIMKTTTTGRNNGIQWTLWTQLDDLDFADDLALLSHNQSQMQDKTTLLETTSAGTGLKINRKKTELMNTTANAPVTVGGEPIREVESFVYLGSVVDHQGGTDRDVTARIGKARAAFVMLKNIWRNPHENQTPHLQLQCEVSPAVRMWDMADNTDDATKDPHILQHLSEAHLQNPMAREDPKWRSVGASGTGTSGQADTAEEVGLDRTHPQESSTTRQALTWNLQGKRKRPASQQL